MFLVTFPYVSLGQRDQSAASRSHRAVVGSVHLSSQPAASWWRLSWSPYAVSIIYICYVAWCDRHVRCVCIVLSTAALQRNKHEIGHWSCSKGKQVGLICSSQGMCHVQGFLWRLFRWLGHCNQLLIHLIAMFSLLCCRWWYLVCN